MTGFFRCVVVDDRQFSRSLAEGGHEWVVLQVASSSRKTFFFLAPYFRRKTALCCRSINKRCWYDARRLLLLGAAICKVNISTALPLFLLQTCCVVGIVSCLSSIPHLLRSKNKIKTRSETTVPDRAPANTLLRRHTQTHTHAHTQQKKPSCTLLYTRARTTALQRLSTTAVESETQSTQDNSPSCLQRKLHCIRTQVHTHHASVP